MRGLVGPRAPEIRIGLRRSQWGGPCRRNRLNQGLGLVVVEERVVILARTSRVGELLAEDSRVEALVEMYVPGGGAEFALLALDFDPRTLVRLAVGLLLAQLRGCQYGHGEIWNRGSDDRYVAIRLARESAARIEVRLIAMPNPAPSEHGDRDRESREGEPGLDLLRESVRGCQDQLGPGDDVEGSHETDWLAARVCQSDRAIAALLASTPMKDRTVFGEVRFLEAEGTCGLDRRGTGAFD